MSPVRGCSSVGRVLEWHSRGHGFDSRQLHKRKNGPAFNRRTICFFKRPVVEYRARRINYRADVIFTSPFPDIDLPEVALSSLVLRHADRLADKPAFIDGATGRVVTFGEFALSVKRFAGGLVAHGFAKGAVVAVMAPNSAEYAIAFHGTAYMGGIVTTINPTYTEREVHHQLTDAGADVLVTVKAFLDTATAATNGTGVKHILVIDSDEAVGSAEPFVSWFGEALAHQVPVDAHDLVALPYSSGTTGLSKGVMLTHHNLVSNVLQVNTVSGLNEHESIDAILPFFHIYGMQVMMNCGLAAGSTIVSLGRFDLVQFLTMHQTYKITRSYLAPPVVLALAKMPIVADYDLSGLRIVMSGAAPLSAELALEAGSRLGVEVVQGYGMTEMSPVSHVTASGQFKPGSVGVTVPNARTKIVDPSTNEPLGIGHDGEVWVSGPNVMAGYLNNPNATEATIDADGWLHTGDLGHIDADGHLYIVDRLKELIKYKGYQVPPAELEALLLTHPSVADSAVIGIPDDEAGELPVAFISIKPGHETTTDEIMAFVNDQVAHYKKLRRITVIDVIPKSASGKILRRELRKS